MSSGRSVSPHDQYIISSHGGRGAGHPGGPGILFRDLLPVLLAPHEPEDQVVLGPPSLFEGQDNLADQSHRDVLYSFGGRRW